MGDVWFSVEVRGGAIIVSAPEHKFEAVYFQTFG